MPTTIVRSSVFDLPPQKLFRLTSMDAKKYPHDPAARGAAGAADQDSQTLPFLTKPPAAAASVASAWYPSPRFAGMVDGDPRGHLSEQQWPGAMTPSVPETSGVDASTNMNTTAATATATAAASDGGNSASPNAVSKARKPPRKTNNAAAGKSTLFWVHTDPQSVSQGTREETLKRIRSHVMSEHNRKKRLENNKRYKTKTWKHLAFQPVETPADAASASAAAPANPVVISSPGMRAASSTPDREHEDCDTSSASPISTLHSGVASSPSYPPSRGSDASPAESVSSDQSSLVVANSGPYGFIAQGTFDPFHMLPTPLSERMLRHLQHFLVNLTSIGVPLQNRSGARLKRHWSALVQRDQACLQACICVAASNTALATGEFPLTDPSKRFTSPLILDTFHARGETIRLVNEGLSDSVKAASDELIAAVSNLLTIEIASGNPDYLKVHLAGLRQMVGLRDSFADVPADVRFQISWTDIRVACMALSKPIFPFVRGTPPPPPKFPISAPNEDLSVMALRLLALTQIPGFCGTVMTETIFDLLQLTWYTEWVKSFGYQVFDEETEEYFNHEILYVEYTLHSDRFTPESGEIKGDATLEGCLRFACLLFHNTSIWQFYPSNESIFPRPVQALRMALESTIPAGYFKHCPDLLIWILVIGACSSNDSRERQFFVAELVPAVSDYGLRSWQDLRLLLMGFFYLDRAYLGPVRALWEELRVVAASVTGTGTGHQVVIHL